MSTDLIEMWHQRARPNPVQRDFDVQLGCHFEEVVEMMDALVLRTNNTDVPHAMNFTVARNALHIVAERLKDGTLGADISNRKEFLDAVADQIVTGIGAAHCAHMKPTEAVYRVNHSNWSKYDVDGQPIFDDNGKVKKGPRYAPPDLTGLY